jgi:hypothetical protein
MKFGVREICDVVFKAKASMQIGNHTFTKGQPVLYIDTAKTSTLEGSGTTVYAQGGKGNARLMAWEGERALTFTVEDALLSPIGMSILSGAGLFKGADNEEKVHVHTTAYATVDNNGVIEIDTLKTGEQIDGTAPVFVAIVEADGSITGELVTGATVDTTGVKLTGLTSYKNRNVFVDFYVLKKSNTIAEVQIDAATFGGYFYVEASTLFKDQESGKDLPAEITLPNVKIQSNFTFNMSSTGDPSTFSFVMDAFPGYTMFNKNKKVMCAIQILEDEVVSTTSHESVMKHPAGFTIEESGADSTDATGENN